MDEDTLTSNPLPTGEEAEPVAMGCAVPDVVPVLIAGCLAAMALGCGLVMLITRTA